MSRYLFKNSRDTIYKKLDSLEYRDLDEKYNLTTKFATLLNSEDVIKETADLYNYCSDSEDSDRLLELFKLDDKGTYMDNYQDIREGVIDNFESYDCDKIREANSEDVFPLYFVFNNSSALISKIIRAATKADFSHVSISINGVNDLVSFATSYRNGKSGGLINEDIYELINVRNPLNLGIYALMINEKQLTDLAVAIEYFKKRSSNYKYSWKKLITYPFVPKRKLSDYEVNNELYCSEFIGWLLHTSKINTKLEGNQFINVSPNDYEKQLSMSKCIPLFKGETKLFDIRKILSFEKRLNVNTKQINSIIKSARELVDENDKLLQDRVDNKLSLSDLSLK